MKHVQNEPNKRVRLALMGFMTWRIGHKVCSIRYISTQAWHDRRGGLRLHAGETVQTHWGVCVAVKSDRVGEAVCPLQGGQMRASLLIF